MSPQPLFYGPLRLPTPVSPLAAGQGSRTCRFAASATKSGALGLGGRPTPSVARGLIEGSQKTLPAHRPPKRRTSRSRVQIFGGEPEVMRRRRPAPRRAGVDSIDINMGCPVKRITGGVGSADDVPARPTRSTSSGPSSSPCRSRSTVKMRLGWDEQQITAPFFAREFEQTGVAPDRDPQPHAGPGFSGTGQPLTDPAGRRSGRARSR